MNNDYVDLGNGNLIKRSDLYNSLKKLNEANNQKGIPVYYEGEIVGYSIPFDDNQVNFSFIPVPGKENIIKDNQPLFISSKKAGAIKPEGFVEDAGDIIEFKVSKNRNNDSK